MIRKPVTPRDELTEAYQSWGEWTRREGDAIQAADWMHVRQCQEAKRHLQTRILQLTDATQRQCLRGEFEAADLERQVRSLVANLITLENRNEQLLREQQQKLEAQREQLEEANRNLRRVQRAYG